MYYLWRLGKYIFKIIQKKFFFDEVIEILVFEAFIEVIYLTESFNNATGYLERVFFYKSTF